MQLIVITPDHTLTDESTIVNELFACGLERLHMRKPLYSTEQYRKYIGGIAPQYHGRVVLHSHFELCDEFELGGVHVSSFARGDTEMWEKIKNIHHQSVSGSFHSWQELLDNEFDYGYVFISPVFDSISKSGYKAGIDLTGANEIKLKLHNDNKYCPGIIGLGGVGVPQVSILHRYGFDGAVLLGAIWLSENPVQIFKDAMNTVQSVKRS